MHILIDECLPKQLRDWLEGHQVMTVQEAGWAGIKNGKLLRLADSGGFDVFMTADRNMYYQQNFSGLGVSAIVIPSNRKLLVKKSVPAILQSLQCIQPSQKVVMDLGLDAGAWQSMVLHRVQGEELHTTHVFVAGPELAI